MSIEGCIRTTLPTTAAWSYRAVAFRATRAAVAENISTLTIGTSNVDVDITSIGMFNIQHHISNIVHISDSGIGCKSREEEFRAIRTAVGLAIDAVGEENARDLGKGGLVADNANRSLKIKSHLNV